MPRLIDCLCKFIDVRYNCIIAGDLNCADIDWTSLRAPTDGTQDLLLNFAISRGFTQVVERPTRNDNLLDVVLNNEPVTMCHFDTST